MHFPPSLVATQMTRETTERDRIFRVTVLEVSARREIKSNGRLCAIRGTGLVCGTHQMASWFTCYTACAVPLPPSQILDRELIVKTKFCRLCK